MATKTKINPILLAIVVIMAFAFMMQLSYTGFISSIYQQTLKGGGTGIVAQQTTPPIAQQVNLPVDLIPELRIEWTPQANQGLGGFCLVGYYKNNGPGIVPKGTQFNTVLSEIYNEGEGFTPVMFGGGNFQRDMKAGEIWIASIGPCQTFNMQTGQFDKFGAVKFEIDTTNAVQETNENNNVIDVFNNNCYQSL